MLNNERSGEQVEIISESKPVVHFIISKYRPREVLDKEKAAKIHHNHMMNLMIPSEDEFKKGEYSTNYLKDQLRNHRNLKYVRNAYHKDLSDITSESRIVIVCKEGTTVDTKKSNELKRAILEFLQRPSPIDKYYYKEDIEITKIEVHTTSE